jgi:uncharacterized protein (TIGR02421 family)
VDKQTKKLDQELYNIAEQVEKNLLNYINPTNSKKQKELFFESIKKHSYELPHFEYIPIKKNSFLKLKDEIKEIQNQLSNSKIDEFLKNRAANLEKEVDLLLSINTNKFCRESKRSYEKPSKEMLKLSEEILQKYNDTKTKETFIPIEQVKKQLEEKMNQNKTNFCVVIDEQMSAKAAVNLNEKKVKLNKNSLFTTNDVDRLFVHEVETHVYRYLNGKEQEVKSMAFGSGGEYLQTEEGLALYNEIKSKVESKEQEKKYAGRAIAADYALKHDFFETFDYLCKYFDKEEAYAITQRVKRGIPYASKGAFTKDYCYLAGILEIKKEVENGLNVKELYYGKICASEVGLVRKIPLLKEAKYLPTWIVEKN